MLRRPENRFYTVMIVPERSARARRFQVSKRSLWALFLLGGLVFLAGATMAIHYVHALSTHNRNSGDVEALLRENARLSEQIEHDIPALRDRVKTLSAKVEKVERLDTQLRAFTHLSDPERNVALGPLQGPPGEVGEGGEDDAVDGNTAGAAEPSPTDSATRRLEMRLMNARIDRAEKIAGKEEKSLANLLNYFDKQRVLLASTPSIWPVRGWLSSVFGIRRDPFTSKHGMHRGLDIVTDQGVPIVATADGVVVTAHTEATTGLGRHVIIDHGRGVTTRYGHMVSVAVKQGERVTRGQKIGLVGSTGRSTGPHLHYEVHIDGVPQNPTRFILD